MRVRGKPVSCCFTGHRPAKLPWGTDEGDERCLRLKARLREVIARAVEDGYTHFICGMAEGCDLYCAEAVLALRERGDARGGDPLPDAGGRLERGAARALPPYSGAVRL